MFNIGRQLTKELASDRDCRAHFISCVSVNMHTHWSKRKNLGRRKIGARKNTALRKLNRIENSANVGFELTHFMVYKNIK